MRRLGVWLMSSEGQTMGASVLGRTGYSKEPAKGTDFLTVAVRLRTDATELRKRLVLMEIVGWHGFFSDVQRLEAGGSNGEDIVDVLHFAFDDQVGVVEDSGALAIENVGHDYGVGDAG